MRKHATIAILALALSAAACGSDPQSGGGGGDLMLRYAYSPGQELSYDVDLSMDMTMESSGGGAIAGSLDTEMLLSVDQRVDLAFSEGPQPDQIEIRMPQELLEGGAQMKVMGQTEYLPMEVLAAELDTTTVVVVDALGQVVEASVGGQPLPTDLLNEFGSLGSGTMLQPQHLGPAFPEHGLAVGGSWTTTTEMALLGFDITQTARNEVVGEEEILGHHTYRIDTVVTTDPIAASMADMLEAMKDSPEMAALSQAELDEISNLIEGMGVDLRYRIPLTTIEMTTWFDAAAGVVVRLHLDSNMEMEVSMSNVPGAGELEMTAEMNSTQRMELTS